MEHVSQDSRCSSSFILSAASSVPSAYAGTSSRKGCSGTSRLPRERGPELLKRDADAALDRAERLVEARGDPLPLQPSLVRHQDDPALSRRNALEVPHDVPCPP